ncbi:MAG: tRNA 2-selenouridine(34) synthase MnmH [Flexistipes sinusarabici]|uniref:tRNA 2-selenouridine(34) synthase MnmH n=1 Tax=Flexistipes sinusarabici TaxID=2352 RepID=A0A5D0MMS9_FLESI|nr:tRNA 2-selenouridine(34) synthase MnmH [Flexistipes sinusarabici]TYB33702.1 MAG: tRNA 2-selenouridine(34) synthase MnmH [Flexistipes sinusarabici]
MEHHLEINIETIITKGLNNYNIVDVRSESEFLHDHIPGAVNIPLLNDEERKIVGTLYKQKGPKTARLKGVDIVSPKLPDFIKAILSQNTKKNTVVYCWRGGLRSEASVNFLKLAGIDRVFKLRGGYKQFRKHINDFFADFPEILNIITLYGPTGCAKTEILEKLSSTMPVINLEKYACHKGSVFGEIGERFYTDVTQKNFETNIWHNLYKNNFKGPFITEGESRRIGKVNIPERLYSRIKNGFSVLMKAPLQFRIEYTIKAYNPDNYIDEIKTSLRRIKKFLGGTKTAYLEQLLDNKEFYTFTEILLKEYYDPLYNKSIPSCPDHEICYNSLDEAVEKVRTLYEKITFA